MIETLIKWILYAFIIVITAWVIPGISVANFFSAMIVCVVLALLNILLKPFLQFISFPINFITFGLFSFVINAFLIYAAGKISPGFEVESFLAAFLGAIFIALVGTALERIKAR